MTGDAGPVRSRRSPLRAASNSALTGEKTDEIATERMPVAAMSSGDPADLAGVERRDLAAVELVAAMAQIGDGRPIALTSVGPVDHRRQRRVAGRPSRSAAVGARLARFTTALVKCVVPIITARTWAGSKARICCSASSASMIPLVTSLEVDFFTPANTCDPSIKTASVFVPPTSMPIRRLLTLSLIAHPPVGPPRGHQPRCGWRRNL